MRSFALRPSLAVLGFVCATAACGGGAPNDVVANPGSPGSNGNGAPGAATGPGSAMALDGGAATTTTIGLDSANDGGTKLANVGATRGPDPGRSRDDIKGIVLAHREQARACYDNALPNHPGIEGDIDIKWTIDPKGDVSDIAVDPAHTTILEPSVGQCLMTVLMAVKFSESPRGLETHAHYPFNFHPRTNVPGQTIPSATSPASAPGH